MSYVPKRDIFVEIIVPQACCRPYQSSGGADWVEVFVPPENAGSYGGRWGSIMVKPEQTAFIPDTQYNVIYVNEGAKIINSVKDDARRVLSEETLLPQQIIGRYLKWYEIQKYTSLNTWYTEYPSHIYQTFWKRSRFSLWNYIREYI